MIRAFLNGAREFRSDLTMHYDDERCFAAYDWGREVAHRLTLRYWDFSHPTHDRRWNR